MKNSCTYTMLCLLALLLCMACETAQEESDSQNTGDSTEMNAEMNAGMNTDDTMEQMNPDPMPEMEMEMEMTDPMDPMDEEPAEVVLTSLRVEADRILNRYHTSQLSVTAIMSDGSEMLIEEGLTWSSSDDNIVTIDEQGVMYGVHMGDFTINVRYEDIEESWSSTVGCRYPNFPSALKYNNVMPSVGWDDAHRADGSEFRFTLKDFYCSEEWDEYTSIIFMIKAAWCAPCTNYVQNELNPIAEELRDDGALILYMEAQDLDFELADSNYAFQHIRRLIGDGIGIRVGDKSTMTIDSQDQVVPGYMQQFISSFPTTVIIRRSDMRIVTDSNRSNSYLPL